VSLPAEFFTPEELAEILGTPQHSRQCELLEKQGVPFVRAASGKPRVYRDKLLPAAQIPQNDDFDFSSLAPGARRKAKETVQ
jgi:hypothetical protein